MPKLKYYYFPGYGTNVYDTQAMEDGDYVKIANISESGYANFLRRTTKENYNEVIAYAKKIAFKSKK